MGQRHQFFLHIKNPVHNSRIGDAEKKKLEAFLGTGETTILAFHHQWLYGRSAVVNIMNMFDITNPETMSMYSNPFSDNYSAYTDDWVKDVVNLISVQTNPLHPRGIGFEKVHFLNPESPEMMENFTYGDNNDGISIIDTITRKYCMMNIYKQKTDEDYRGSVSVLPKLQPADARAYMRAYYGEAITELSDYYTEGKSDEDINTILLRNKLDNIKFEKELDNRCDGLLTLKEVKTLFPKVYLEKNTYNY